MASRAILRRKKSIFDSINPYSAFIQSFSCYENQESSTICNSCFRSAIHQLPNEADRREENSHYRTIGLPNEADRREENSHYRTIGLSPTIREREFTMYLSWEHSSLGSRTNREQLISPLAIRLVLHNRCYLSTASAGSENNNKNEEAAIKLKKEPSPEECDQAVEGLSSVKAKAKAKQLHESHKAVKPLLRRMWAIFLGIGPALKAIASMSSEDWARKLRHWKDEFKSTLQHYWLGTKLLWADVRISSRLLLKLAGGKSLSRRERQQLTRTTADIFRLVPFAVFIIVPFMEFLLPVFLKLFPNMLPSTFQDKMKEQEALKRRLNARIEYAKFLQETVKEMAKEVQNSRGGEVKKTAEDLDEFMNKVRRGAQVSNEEILGFAKLFNDELTLDNISRPRLVNMCKYMGISPFGTDAYLRHMLRQKLQNSSQCMQFSTRISLWVIRKQSLGALVQGIKNDDKLIQLEGVESLSEEELRQACRDRGLLGLLSVDEMIQQLHDWLELSLNHSVPSSLLILSRAFSVSGKVKPEEAVQATLSSLPDEVVDTVGVTTLPSEDSVSERRRKLEFLGMQEELIKEEEEREEETQARMRDSAAKQMDIALEEMTVPTKREAEELKNAKGLDKQEQLCEISRALAVLASASSVSQEREEFLRLVKKEIDLYNSVVNKEGTEGEEEINKAYRASREDIDDTTETAVDDKVSSALIDKVDAMLHNLEKEIDDVDAKIGDGWRLLDRDYDGKVTTEEVASAANYLKDTLAKDGIQQLISNLSKDREGKIRVEDIVRLASKMEDSESSEEKEDKRGKYRHP